MRQPFAAPLDRRHAVDGRFDVVKRADAVESLPGDLRPVRDEHVIELPPDMGVIRRANLHAK